MSRMLRALSVLGAGAAGWVGGMREADADKERDEDRKYQKELRTRQRMQWDKQDRLERDLGDAAAARTVDPNMVKPDTADDRDVGTPGTVLEQQGYRVGSQRFDDQGAAQSAADAANTRSGRMNRTYDVLARSGNVVGAEQLRSGMMQADAAEATTKAAAAERDRQDKLRDMVSTLAAGGPAAIPEVYSRYNDGKSATVQADKDGSFTVTTVGADGKPAGTAKFRDMEDFIAKTASRFNPDLYITSEARRRESERAQGNADRDYGLRVKDSETRGRREERMAAAAERTAAAAERKAAEAQGLKFSDLEKGHGAIAKVLTEDYKTQIEGAPTPKDADPIKRTREAEIAEVQRLYTGAMMAGMALTPEQAIAAYRTGTRRTGTALDKAGKAVKIEGIESGGRFIPLMAAPGAELPAAAPAAPAVPAPPIEGMPETGWKPPQRMAAQAAPVAAPVAPQAAPQAAAGDPALQRLQADAQAQVAQLNQAVVQARQQLAAASRSGDPNALQAYSQALQRAVSERDAVAQQRLGNAAPAFLATLPQ